MAETGYRLSQNAVDQVAAVISKVNGAGVSGSRRDGLPPLLPSTAAAKATNAPVPGIITSASNGIYGVDLYANGYTQASTGSGYLIALELSYGETVPIGTKVIVSPWQLTATGSGD